MKLVFAALLLIAPSAGMARNLARSGAVYVTSPIGMRGYPPTLEDERICLTRKVTRALECRTRAQWTQIAARLSREQAERP